MMTALGVLVALVFALLGFGMVAAMIADGDAFDPGRRYRGR